MPPARIRSYIYLAQRVQQNIAALFSYLSSILSTNPGRETNYTSIFLNLGSQTEEGESLELYRKFVNLTVALAIRQDITLPKKGKKSPRVSLSLHLEAIETITSLNTFKRERAIK